MFKKILSVSLSLLVFTSCSSSEPETVSVYSKETFIYYALANTFETHAHNLGGVTTNEVFMNTDGREAVFDENEELVTDCLNAGTNNYFFYSEDPLLHFAADTAPWFEFGNCEGDSSTREERVGAFAKDFVDGIALVIESTDPIGEIDMEQLSESEVQVINLFLNIFATDGLKEFNFDGSDPWVESAEDFDKFSAKMITGVETVMVPYNFEELLFEVSKEL